MALSENTKLPLRPYLVFFSPWRFCCQRFLMACRSTCGDEYTADCSGDRLDLMPGNGCCLAPSLRPCMCSEDGFRSLRSGGDARLQSIWPARYSCAPVEPLSA